MGKMLRSPADAAGSAPQLREPFAAFLSDDASRQAAIKAANEQGWTGSQIVEGGIAAAIETLTDTVTPRVILIDISESSSPYDDVDRLAEVCQKGTHVVALGSVNDINIYRRLIESGIDDYLVKPVTSDQLNTAFTRVTRGRPAANESAPPGRLIVLIGTHGGVGSSAIANNLAWVVAHELKKRTALVDLDLQFGSAALTLDIEPGRGLAEALRNPGRIDDLLVERSSVKVGERLCVFCGEEGLDQASHVDPAAVDALITRVRSSFECAFVDLPRNLTPSQASLINAADAVVVVTDYTLISARDCPRLLKRIHEVAPRAQAIVVANRVGAPGHSDVNRTDLEKSISAKVEFEIPEDQKSADEAVQAGKPIIASASRSKVAAVVREIVQKVCGTVETPKLSLWHRLTSKVG